ncbi:MAG: hypothetical protein CMK07_05270, partial [Ponticaulis sp.]|nr:hypothetical protein [Ponticaulis sp.]
MDDLPGTLVSAKRFIDWAVNDQFGPKIKPDNVLTLTDDDDNPLTNGGAVSVELLKEHIKPFLENRMIDRLVVYFAGHGIARSESDQFWLLTNAEFDTSQGIDVRLFRRKLGKYGFGQFNDDLANEGQVWLIGDACRNPANSALEFDGDAILTMGGRTKDTVFDLFFATSLGDFAYQVPGDGAAAVPYCLFSQAFLDCMSGEFLDAIETEHHQ